ncbi:MAG: hypothetical protein JEY94_00540 [Melioribacteraceae bacterium]|nr:hypothetical protein [Melioribacteraceae bacterium]
MITPVTLIDSHVHFQNCFTLETFLWNSYSNFKRNAEKIGSNKNFNSFLFLTDGYEEGYKRILKSINRDLYYSGNKISLIKSADEESINVKINDSNIYIIPGKQIITKENLEVLVVGSNKTSSKKTDVYSTIRDLSKSGNLVILPLGIGKWLGKRGLIVDDIIKKGLISFLGDNGGVSSFIKSPRQFESAKNLEIRILPGTDPLPIKSEIDRPGSFGFFLKECKIDKNKPFSSLLTCLKIPQKEIISYGHRISFLNLIKYQIYMRYLKFTK